MTNKQYQLFPIIDMHIKGTKGQDLKDFIHKKLPIALTKGLSIKASNQLFLTIALQRSGQHAVIEWICRQLDSAIHLNHCTFIRQGWKMMPIPMAGRHVIYSEKDKIDSGILFKDKKEKDLDIFFSKIGSIKPCSNIIYSFEDISLENQFLSNLIRSYNLKIILILRNPYNWLASSFRHKNGVNSLSALKTKKDIFVTYLEQVLDRKNHIDQSICIINFERWLQDIEYRKHILEELEIPESSNESSSIKHVQTFGGGSSFDGCNINHELLSENVLERWKLYEDNKDYRQILSDKYFEELTFDFFKAEKPF